MSKIGFCAVPWNHLHVTALKSFGLCCISDTYRDFESRNFEEHWNSDGMKNLRVQMMNNDPPKDHCFNCVVNRNTNFNLYDFQNEKAEPFVEEMIEKTSPDGYTTYLPKTIDVRTNLCNLKCRTCGPSSSTSIRQEMIRFEKTVNHLGSLNIDELGDLGLSDDLIKSITHLTWAGGEPFMSPVHWIVMDKLAACGNTDVVIRYNTNLTFPGKTFQRAVDLLKQFSSITICASLDGVGEDGEYIREGLNYEEYVHNLTVLKDVVANFFVDFTATSIGLLSLPQMIQLCLDNDVQFAGRLARFHHKKDHFLLVDSLRSTIMLGILDQSIEASKGTKLEHAVTEFCDFAMHKYSPMIPDLQHARELEMMRGKTGYFESRMNGLLNE